MDFFNLMSGELAELDLAIRNGALWGDIVQNYEQDRLDQLREQLAEMVALQTPGRWRVGREILEMEVALPWHRAAPQPVSAATSGALEAADETLAATNAQEEEYEEWLAEQEEGEWHSGQAHCSCGICLHY